MPGLSEETFIVKQTEFNMAIATQQRIDHNIKVAHDAMAAGDLITYKRYLDRNWLEVDYYINKEFSQEFKKDFYDLQNTINKRLNSFISLRIDLKNDHDYSTKNVLAHTIYIFEIELQRYELKIREVLIKKGMLNIEKEDITMAVLED